MNLLPQLDLSYFNFDIIINRYIRYSCTLLELHSLFFIVVILFKAPWKRDRLPTPIFLSFPGSSDSKESACNEGDLGLILGLRGSSGGEHGHPLQYSCLENPHGQRILVRYSPWGRKGLETTERQSIAQHIDPFSSH